MEKLNVDEVVGILLVIDIFQYFIQIKGQYTILCTNRLIINGWVGQMSQFSFVKLILLTLESWNDIVVLYCYVANIRYNPRTKGSI